jgi:beta-glucosidase-like glycosyl hydrolase
MDLPPFRAAVEAGVDTIMVGHLAVPALDPTDTPASLSRPITTGLLRDRLGWSAAILTDDLEMGALAVGERGAGEIAVRAMAAGADLLFFCHTHDRVRAAADALVTAVVEGRLEETRLREAADHVGDLAGRVASAPARAGGLPEGAAVVEEAVRAGVRVVRPPPVLPGGAHPAVLSLVDGRLTAAESAAGDDELLGAARRRGLPVETQLDAAGLDALVIGVRRPPAEVLARIDAVSRRLPTTVIALAEPWLLDRLPAAGAIAACDSGRAACERALELALAGSGAEP